MALGYAWFDSYDSVGYVLTLHISPIKSAHTCGTDLGQNGPCRNCNLSSEKEEHAHSYINTNYVEGMRGLTPTTVSVTF